jgi:ribosomal protein S1
MIQKIKIKNEHDILDDKFIEIEVDKKTKILSTEPYVKELYDLYLQKTPNYKEIDDNSITEGLITKVTDTQAIIQINEKYSTVLDLTKEKKEYIKYIQPNKIIDLKVTKNKDSYNASFSSAVQDLKYKEIYDSINQKVAYLAKVKELTNGGYFLNIDGITVFMPGSLAGMNKLSNFEELLGKEIYVMPVNYSKQFKLIVVSHREYLKTLLPLELEKVKYDIEYTGRITGINKYGIFIEFNTENNLENPFIITGLIPTSEMDKETKEKFEKKELKAGDYYKFYVKNIVNEKKVILTKFYINWVEMIKKYKINTDVKCKVEKKQDNLLFLSIDDTRLMGTIHNYKGNVEIGDIIELQISKIDLKTKKIFLKKINKKKKTS